MKPQSSFKAERGLKFVEISVEVKNTTPQEAKNVVVTASLKSGKKLKLNGPNSLGRFEGKTYILQSEDLTLEEVKKVRGDKKDPLSKGSICPKGVLIHKIHDDPNRLKTPLRKSGSFINFLWKGTVVLTPSMINSSSARSIFLIHSSRVWARQMIFAIIES